MPYTVRYHCQNNPTFCGNACAQMLIFSLDGVSQIQQEPWRNCLDDSGWGAFPPNLIKCFNGLPNKPPGLTFRLLICNTETVISRWIAYTIRKNRPPPMVLVWGDDHWVLVTECFLNVNPLEDKPTTQYDINHFKVFDPAVANSSTIEAIATCRNNALNTYTQHHATDTDKCGRGVISINCGTGTCNLHVGTRDRSASYSYWRNHWLYRFPPMIGLTHDWHGKYLAVVAVAASDPISGTDFTSWTATGIECP